MTTDAGTRITAEQVRLLLSDPKIFPDLDADDTELVLDSLGLVWFLHLLELRHGIALDPDDEHVTGVTSVLRITEGLANHG
ncbi:hypothetical protein AB5J62_21220 [Amycolatopsis sp. cg5]|uniref:hypothetical protein n=1 Tax=Amycolatopsis sp. cg5 TaxID=3238802 RepID=UPI003524B8E7